MITLHCKNNIKRFITLLCVALLTLTMPVNASGKIRVKSDGLYQYLTVEPIVKDETIMIAVTDFSRILKASAVWDRTTKTAIIKKGEFKLEVKAQKDEAYFNGEQVNLLTAASTNNDTVYLPLIEVCDLFGVDASWNDRDNVISVDTGSSFLALDLGDIIEDGAIVLSYDEAVRRAIASNNSLKNLEDNVELIEKSLEWSEYSFYGISYVPYSDIIALVRQVDSFENSLSSIPLSKELNEDLSKFMVFNSATSIESMKLDIKLLEESIALEEENIKNLEIKNKLGIVSDNEVKTAKLSVDLSKSNLELLRISFDAEYQTLNRLLKSNLKNKTIISYEPDIVKFSVANIDGYIEQKIKNAPTIKLKEISLNQAEYQKNTSSYEVDETGLDLIKTENDYKAAERDLNDSKLDLEKTIRSLYNQLKQLEGKEKTLGLDLEKAINSYNNAVTNYEAGNAIMYQVEQARLGILKVEVDLQKNRIDYDKLKFLIDKPYLSSIQSS